MVSLAKNLAPISYKWVGDDFSSWSTGAPWVMSSFRTLGNSTETLWLNNDAGIDYPPPSGVKASLSDTNTTTTQHAIASSNILNLQDYDPSEFKATLHCIYRPPGTISEVNGAQQYPTRLSLWVEVDGVPHLVDFFDDTVGDSAFYVPLSTPGVLPYEVLDSSELQDEILNGSVQKQRNKEYSRIEASPADPEAPDGKWWYQQNFVLNKRLCEVLLGKANARLLLIGDIFAQDISGYGWGVGKVELLIYRGAQVDNLLTPSLLTLKRTQV